MNSKPSPAELQARVLASPGWGDLLPKDDPAAQSLLASLEEEWTEKSASLSQPPDRSAHTELVFSGDPVRGSSGIKVQFAGQAVRSFEKLVTGRLAEQHGRRRANASASLHLTGVLTGSFGFVLEELGQRNMTPSPLAEAVEDTGRLLIAATLEGPDLPESLRQISSSTWKRLRLFLGLLKTHGAALRMVTPNGESWLSQDAVRLGAARMNRVVETSDTDEYIGTFGGAMVLSRRFEFLLENGAGGLWEGNVAEDVEDEALSDFAQWTGRRCLVKMRITHRESTEGTWSSYELLSVRPAQTLRYQQRHAPARVGEHHLLDRERQGLWRHGQAA